MKSTMKRSRTRNTTTRINTSVNKGRKVENKRNRKGERSNKEAVVGISK